jgi:hypothetical protein
MGIVIACYGNFMGTPAILWGPVVIALDSKLADYFVNSVGQLAGMLTEFAIAGSNGKRPA